MGASDWSDQYSLEGYAAEAMAAIDAAELDGGGHGVVIAAHSLGGNPAMIAGARDPRVRGVICIDRSEEHTSELQSLMRISYAVFCLKKKKSKNANMTTDDYVYAQTVSSNIKT